jgi:aminoglycoside phosphotransferase (APT) family kinase protein
VRLPRRAAAAALLANELRWLPVLAPRLPLPVPEPVVAGHPTRCYPWPWAVVRWVPGEPIGTSDVATSDPLLVFFDALHQPAPTDAPGNPYRGGPLADRDARLRDGCAILARRGWETVPIRRAWDRALTAQPYDGPPLWLHGDLHTANLLAHRASISGVIDFGDLTAGDPACDHLIAWMLPAHHRRQLRQAAERHGPDTWERARGWAVAWAVAVLSASDVTPLLRAIGSKALAAACASEG